MNTTVERSTDVIAAAGVTSPVWLPGLSEVSEIAALLLPIAGVVWLGVQIYYHIKKNRIS